MNIPNLLTLARIILVPIFVISLIHGDFAKALIIFIVACVTDGLDGFLARVLKQKTELGAHLDPLADKTLIATAFITLSVLHIIPSWLTVIVISRDIVILVGISVLFFMSIPFEISPAFVSKITTVFQFVTVLLVLTFEQVPLYRHLGVLAVLYWVTALVTVVSGLNYIARGVKLINGAD